MDGLLARSWGHRLSLGRDVKERRVAARTSSSCPSVALWTLRTGALPARRKADFKSFSRSKRTTVFAAAAPTVGDVENSTKGALEMSKRVADMNVRSEVSAENQVLLTVTVPASMVRLSWSDTLDQARKEVQVPGFRKTASKKKQGGKGQVHKVPDALVIREFGLDTLRMYAVQTLLESSLPTAMEQYASRGVDGSERIVSDVKDLVRSFDVDQPLVYQARLELAPQVTWKGDYRDIKVAVHAAGDDATDALAVEKSLRQEIKRKAVYRVKAEGGLEMGDCVVMSVKMRQQVGDGWMHLGDHARLQLHTDTGDEDFIPGVVPKLLGLKVGEVREFEVRVPDNVVPRALAGSLLQLEVEAFEILSVELPEINDSWANATFSGCSLDKVRSLMLKSQESATNIKTEQAITEALTEALADLVDCPTPPDMVRLMGEQEYENRLMEAQSAGQLSFEQMEALATKELLDKFIEMNEDELKRAVRAYSGMQAIYQEQNLEVDPREEERDYRAAALRMKQGGQEVDEESLRDSVRESLQGRAVLDWLKDNCQISILPPLASS